MTISSNLPPSILLSTQNQNTNSQTNSSPGNPTANTTDTGSKTTSVIQQRIQAETGGIDNKYDVLDSNGNVDYNKLAQILIQQKQAQGTVVNTGTPYAQPQTTPVVNLDV